jgi:hypothetical protein
LLALPGVGIEVAGQLLVTAGDNPDRLHSGRSSAARRYICGVDRVFAQVIGLRSSQQAENA